MRAVSGFERPAIQWLFVALAVVLIVLGGAVTLALWRTRADIETLRAANLQARVDQQAIEARLARETAARESLSLELARLRGSAAAVSAPPTLTLQPLRSRGSLPPPATVEAPGAALVIELRLLLPAGGRVHPGPYAIALRDWSGGDVLWTRGRVPQGRVDGRPAVVALMSGDVLRSGAFEITVTAADGSGARVDVAAYEVTVR
jgi:hypothetical protein